MLSKAKLFLGVILWNIMPKWLGTLIYKRTGYLMAITTNSTDGIIGFYFVKQFPDDFRIYQIC